MFFSLKFNFNLSQNKLIPLVYLPPRRFHLFAETPLYKLLQDESYGGQKDLTSFFKRRKSYNQNT